MALLQIRLQQMLISRNAIQLQFHHYGIEVLVKRKAVRFHVSRILR